MFSFARLHGGLRNELRTRVRNQHEEAENYPCVFFFLEEARALFFSFFFFCVCVFPFHESHKCFSVFLLCPSGREEHGKRADVCEDLASYRLRSYHVLASHFFFFYIYILASDQ